MTQVNVRKIFVAGTLRRKKHKNLAGPGPGGRGAGGPHGLAAAPRGAYGDVKNNVTTALHNVMPVFRLYTSENLRKYKIH